MKNITLMNTTNFEELEVFDRVELALSTTDKSILNSAKLDSHDLVREAYASNPNLSSEKLDELFKSDDLAILIGASSNINATEANLKFVITRNDSSLVKNNVLKHRNCTASVQLLTIYDKDAADSINELLQSLDRITPINLALVTELLNHKFVTEESFQYVLGINCSPNERETIALNVEVARTNNPNTTEDTFIKMISPEGRKYNEFYSVVEAIACNENVTSKVLELVLSDTTDTNEGAIVAALKNKNLNTDVLETKLQSLLKPLVSNNAKFICSIIANPNITEEQVKLIYDTLEKNPKVKMPKTNDDIYFAICESKSASADIIVKSTDKASKVNIKKLMTTLSTNPKSGKVTLLIVAEYFKATIAANKWDEAYMKLANSFFANPGMTEEIVLEIIKGSNSSALYYFIKPLSRCTNCRSKFLEEMLKNPQFKKIHILAYPYTPENDLLELIKNCTIDECPYIIDNKYASDKVVEAAILRVLSLTEGRYTPDSLSNFYKICSQYLLEKAFNTENTTKNYKEIIKGAINNKKATTEQLLKIFDNDLSVSKDLSSGYDISHKVLLKIINSTANDIYTQSTKVSVFNENREITEEIISVGLLAHQDSRIKLAALSRTVINENFYNALEDTDPEIVKFALSKIIITNKIIYSLLKKNKVQSMTNIINSALIAELDLLNLALITKFEQLASLPGTLAQVTLINS